MKARTLNRAVNAARADAEQHLPALTAIYQAALEQTATRAARTFASMTAAAWQPPPEGNVLASAAAVAASAAIRARKLQEELLTVIADGTSARIGIAWDVKHPLAQALLAQAGQRTGANIDAAVQPLLRAIIADAYEHGLSVPDTSALIRSGLTDAAPWQAEMLARTDLNGLANGGSLISARLAGAAYKTWLATNDDRTRETHAEADGQTVPVNATFTVGGEQADYPGDPSLSDAEAANCRCSLVYTDSLAASAAAPTLARGGTMPALTAAAIPVKSTPVVDEPWDGGAVEKALPADQKAWLTVYAWYNSGGADPDKDGLPDAKSDWKFPHHTRAGGPANINGVRNALARLPQAQIPAGDVAGVKAHLQRHLDDFAKRKSSAAALSALPAGMQDLPAGVKACALGKTPGYSGGRLCHVHDGTEAGMGAAMRKAKADAAKKNGASLAAASSLGTIPFDGTAAVEGKVSDDNTLAPRVLLPDSLEWPELPVSFMAQTVTAEAHDGAEVAGRVDSFVRKRGTGKLRSVTVMGELTTPFGITEIAPMLADQTMRYVSVDLGASEWALVDRKTFAVVPDDAFDLSKATEGDYALGLTSGKIKALTLVATQAIEGAMVALTASADAVGIGIADLGDGTLRVVVPCGLTLRTGALVAAAAPALPPASWFETPEPPGKMPLTISDDGRVFGHIALADTCHTGLAGVCVTPPRSASGYAYFHVGEVETAEGTKVPVGKLMLSSRGGKHAPLSASRAEAARHYDDTSMVAAYLRATDGRYGIWVAGALNPALSADRVRELRTLPPSGDWREVNGRLELIAALAVPVPGFPVPRAEAALVASADEVELSALVASSGLFEAGPLVTRALERAGLLPDERAADARARALLARAEGGVDGLVALAEA